MKRIYLFFFLATLFGCQKANFNEQLDVTKEDLIKKGSYFWSNNEKVPLAADSNFFLVQTLAPVNSSKIAKANSKNVAILSSSRILIDKIELSTENIISNNEKSAIVKKIASFKTNSTSFKPNGKIVFKPKDINNIKQIENLLKSRADIISHDEYEVYTAEIIDIDKILEIANDLYESNLVEFSHPDFIADRQLTSNDPYYNNQYYLNQPNNIDINAPEAWNLIGSTNSVVKVAVIDDGVEAHEELTGRLLSGYTPKLSNGNGAPNLSGKHGQAVAGIVAAKRNNNISIAGIADNVHIIPVNIFYGNESYADIANAINWAWNQGQADILQNSWSISSTQVIDVVKNAINNAYVNGRNGKGCVIVFSSGNYHPDGSSDVKFNGVAFPANLPNVISVGAVDKNGNISAYSSRGPELDLVAPSGMNGAPDVWTIDRMGSNGYSMNNYTSTFSGTSAAAPMVSGVAALVLSRYPNLTASEVRDLLQTSATDMGTSGLDNTFGYGRVNASAALSAGPTVINGLASICDEGTYTLINPGTVTLENAGGIASLTPLGNNQWKVTRSGQANGNVVLKSVNSNGQSTTKNIIIGTVTAGTISGQGSLQLGESRTFTLNLLDNTDYNWSISYNPNVVMTKNSATSITLSTTGSVPMGWSENIVIRAKAVSNCGTATNEVTKTIKFVNERDPRLD